MTLTTAGTIYWTGAPGGTFLKSFGVTVLWLLARFFPERLSTYLTNLDFKFSSSGKSDDSEMRPELQEGNFTGKAVKFCIPILLFLFFNGKDNGITTI